jgi:2-polyprenyl-3-methyl-5-hydroxy-6-metoxy-1,4-benzoquinol methylase
VRRCQFGSTVLRISNNNVSHELLTDPTISELRDGDHMSAQPENNESITPSTSQSRYPQDYWDEGAEYLRDCYILQHNDDYLEFLVNRVWGLIDPCRLVEFGCGTGKMGMVLLPILPSGSTYTGIDQSNALIDQARLVWAKAPFQSEFYVGTIYDTPFADNAFDIALTHTVLMHVPHPEKVLQEMIRVTSSGGMIITCEANRNAHTALLHIEETNHQESVPLELFQTINREIRKRTGVDHNIGIKIPVLMHKAGLVNIQARKSDAVRCLFPPVDTDTKRRLFKAICDEGYGQPRPDEEQIARWKANLMGYGLPEQSAEYEIKRELEEDYLNNGTRYHTVYTTLLTWSFGTVSK